MRAIVLLPGREVRDGVRRVDQLDRQAEPGGIHVVTFGLGGCGPDWRVLRLGQRGFDLGLGQQLARRGVRVHPRVRIAVPRRPGGGGGLAAGAARRPCAAARTAGSHQEETTEHQQGSTCQTSCVHHGLRCLDGTHRGQVADRWRAMGSETITVPVHAQEANRRFAPRSRLRRQRSDRGLCVRGLSDPGSIANGRCGAMGRSDHLIFDTIRLATGVLTSVSSRTSVSRCDPWVRVRRARLVLTAASIGPAVDRRPWLQEEDPEWLLKCPSPPRRSRP